MIISIVAIAACTEDDPYVENDPYLKAVFYNMDSLKKEGGVNDTLSVVSDSIDILADTLKYVSDSASVLADSLFILNDSINNGGDDSLQDILDELLKQQQIMQGLFEDYTELDSVMKASEDYWDDVSATILSGEVQILSITNRNNGLVVEYEDSATFWNLPLDMNADVSNLLIHLGSEEDSKFDVEFNLDIEYERVISTDEYGNVIVDPFGFTESGIVYSNPPVDSLELNCKSSECLESETSIYIYF